MFVTGGVCGGHSPCPRRGQGPSSCWRVSSPCLSRPGQTWVRADVVFGDVYSQAVGEDVLLLPMEGCAGVDMYTRQIRLLDMQLQQMTCRQGSGNSCDDGMLRSAVYMV